MRICVICSQAYPDSGFRCPSCGCPDDWYNLRELGFPASVDRSYRLVSVRPSGGTRPRLILEERAGGERVSAALLPKSRLRETFLEKLRLQKEICSDRLPQVLRIEEADGGGFFFYEAVEAETLAEQLEQEFPAGRLKAQEIMKEIRAALEDLHAASYRYGSLFMEQIIRRNGRVMFADFGAGMAGRGEGMTMKELRGYLEKGYLVPE